MTDRVELMMLTLAPFALYCGAIPKCELRRGACAFEISDSIAQISLRIGYRAVVHRRSDLFQNEIEYERRFEIADFLIEVLGEVALDGFDRLLGDVVRQGNVNVRPQRL